MRGSPDVGEGMAWRASRLGTQVAAWWEKRIPSRTTRATVECFLSTCGFSGGGDLVFLGTNSGLLL